MSDSSQRGDMIRMADALVAMNPMRTGFATIGTLVLFEKMVCAVAEQLAMQAWDAKAPFNQQAFIERACRP